MRTEPFVQTTSTAIPAPVSLVSSVQGRGWSLVGMALVVWKGIIDYRWSCPTDSDSYRISNERTEFTDSYHVTWQLVKLSYYRA